MLKGKIHFAIFKLGRIPAIEDRILSMDDGRTIKARSWQLNGLQSNQILSNGLSRLPFTQPLCQNETITKHTSVYNYFTFINLLVFQIWTIISSTDFLFKSGIVASDVGNPTGKSTRSFSLTGLSNKTRNLGPQFNGVVVTVTRPA